MAKHSRKSRKKVSMTLISEILVNQEQRDKFSYTHEAVDFKGYIHKVKVSDQTIFDVMLVDFLIEQPQHEAAILFMEDISRSGIYISSPGLEPDAVHQPAKKAANHMAERRMSFSAPYRRVVDDCGPKRASVLMRFMESAHRFPREADERKEFSRIAARLTLPALKSLSRFYKTDNYRDPRRVIASQSR